MSKEIERYKRALGLALDALAVYADPETTMPLRSWWIEVAALREALEFYADQYCEGWCKENGGDFGEDCGGCRARIAISQHQGNASTKRHTVSGSDAADDDD